jgi:hypothetical protein
VYFTNISLINFLLITIIRLTLQTSSVCLWTHFKYRLNNHNYKKRLTSAFIAHLDPDLPNTILKGNHPRASVIKFDSSWLGGFIKEDLWMCFSRWSNVNLCLPCWSCWIGSRPAGCNFERDHPRTIVTKYGSSWPSSLYGEYI